MSTPPRHVQARRLRSEYPWHSRGYLPHFDQPGLVQMVTFRLADALPEYVRHEIEAAAPHERITRADAFLDASHGSCCLRDPGCAAVVEQALRYFDGAHYRLHAWVIMPNHVHVVVEPLDGSSLSEIIQGWKSVSSKGINRLLHRTGRLWQSEYFDRAIRDEEHLQTAITYVEGNPVNAGLVEQAEQWRFGSAWSGRRFGSP